MPSLSARFPLLGLMLLSLAATALGADTPTSPASKSDPRYPFRTDFANADLPWYQPKPLEFPPHHSDRRISGELVSADFVHRKGQFRATKTGELMDFTMPPYGTVQYLNSEADLRDVPLGTFFLFFLNQDSSGGFTRLATMQDQFTMDASHAFSYRLDAVHTPEGKLSTTKQSISKKLDDLGKKELFVTATTRFWKGDQQIKLQDLQPGDALLYNITGKSATSPGQCTDIWVGAETHERATTEQRKMFDDFVKARGVPGWIEETEGRNVTVTLFSGDVRAFRTSFAPDFAKDKDAGLCVANDELRTWNPPVDKERGKINEVTTVPTNCHGSSGMRLKISVTNMLEGFRKGRVVRVFAGNWPAKDQFYGESLMGYGFGRMLNQDLIENVAKEYPEQFPFRTDYGNAHLPWYQVQPGVKPPPFAAHAVFGELLNVDASTRTGQFRKDRTGELVDFTLLPEGEVKYLNADATLADIPSGTRCRFGLHPDATANGAFTLASEIHDIFTTQAGNATTWRVESIRWAEGRMHVAWQLPEVKDYNGDMQRPPNFGRNIISFSTETRVWKGSVQVPQTELAVGDTILANFTGEQTASPARCTDIWIGEETIKSVTKAQQQAYDSLKKRAAANKPSAK